MKSSDLKLFLDNNIPADVLRNIISDEVATYAKLTKKTGSSIPLIFKEDIDLLLTTKFTQKLLNQTIEGNLSYIDLAYICDCLTMGEKVHFENQQEEDII